MEAMKIFLGVDEYGADFPELLPISRASFQDGFHLFRNWVNLQENLGYYSLKNTSAILRGGYTGICIAHSVEFLLINNINFVLVDLPNCRYDQKDLITNPESIKIRQEDVVSGIKPQYRSDPRLKFKQ